jgi:hypothetical protein
MNARIAIFIAFVDCARQAVAAVSGDAGAGASHAHIGHSAPLPIVTRGSVMESRVGDTVILIFVTDSGVALVVQMTTVGWRAGRACIIDAGLRPVAPQGVVTILISCAARCVNRDLAEEGLSIRGLACPRVVSGGEGERSGAGDGANIEEANHFVVVRLAERVDETVDLGLA